MISRASRLVVALLAVAVMVPPLALAQRRARSSGITTGAARALFAELERAYRDLRAIEVQPGDANGQARAWDRRWARRIATIRRQTDTICFDSPLGGTSNCGIQERHALLCTTAYDVDIARQVLFNAPPLPDEDTDRFAARRAVADEAARRQRSNLSCEDLPMWELLHQDDRGEWRTVDDRPLVAASPSEQGRAVPNGESTPAESDSAERGAAGLDAQAIRGVVERERVVVQRCWQTFLRAGGASPGRTRIDVAVSIGPPGTVTEATARVTEVENEIASEDAFLTTCIERGVRRWRFPASRTSTRTQIPFVFLGEGDADALPE